MKNKGLSKESKKQVDEIIQNDVKLFRALVKYDYLINHKNNIDKIYINTFCSLFDLNSSCHLKLKNKKNEYFNLLKKYMNNKGSVSVDTIDKINDKLHEITQQNNAVFSSKLLHMVDNKMPIWDSVLKKHFGIPYRYKSADESKYACSYKKYKEKLEEFIKEEGQYIINKFKEKYGYLNITDIKIIDFVIWCDKENKINIPERYKIIS